MKSFRFLFFISIIIVTAALTFFFFTPPPKLEPFPIATPHHFLCLYGKKLAFNNAERTVKISMSKLNEIKTLFTDQDTSATIIWGGHSLLLYPNSGLEINLSNSRLLVLEGTVNWKKIVEKPTKIYLASSDQSLTLSDAGTLVLDNSSVEISSYGSQAEFWGKTVHQKIDALSRIFIKNDAIVHITSILPQVPEIQPIFETATLRNPKDALIHFSWKTIPETNEYRIRIFSSEGLCPLLLDRIISADRFVMDILRYEADHFFWDVTPYDAETRSYGVPSQMGEIIRTGQLIKETSALLPPKLEIYAMSVSGSMVLIEGFAQSDSELFIDDILVKKDYDGKFIHTINYSKIGLKKIVFRLISPAEIETRLERTVNIYVE